MGIGLGVIARRRSRQGRVRPAYGREARKLRV